MSRRSNSRINEDDGGGDDTSGWMWDRYKGGGGGAPLKNISGGAVTNLRSVMRGSVEVHHSSPSKARRDDDSDDGSNDYRDGRRDHGVSKKHHKTSRNTSDYSDDENDRNSNSRSTEKRRNHDKDRDRDRDTQRNNKRGSNSPLERSLTPEIKKLVSPNKGRGSALRDMNMSESNPEREARARKDLEYQMALKDQIEEKRRNKEDEERKIEATKQKELEEYLNQFYKGNIPPQIKNSMKKKPKSDNYEDDNDSSYNRSSSNSNSNSSSLGGGRKGDNNKSSYDNDESDNRRHRSTSRSRDVSDSDEDRSSSKSSVRNNKSKRNNNSGSNDGWVSQSEYDELSVLCDKLLSQQRELHFEIKSQAKLIDQLQKGGGGNSSVTSSKQVVRSKSAVNSRALRTPGNDPSGVAATRGRQLIQPKAPPTEDRRPGSTKSVGGASRARAVSRDRVSAANNNNSPQKSVTSMRPTGSNNGNSKIGLAGRLQLNNMPSGGSSDKRSAGGNMLKPRMNEGIDYENAIGGTERSSGNSGFAKLANIKKHSGPIVAVHDDDDDNFESRGGRGGDVKSVLKKKSNYPTLRSTELNGDSEYLRIGGEEVDVISGDQLDKLLVHSKKTRAPGNGGFNKLVSY